MTIRTTLIAAGAVIVASLGSIPAASAGGVNVGIHIGHRDHGYHQDIRYYRPLPPHRVRHILRRQGFHQIRDIHRSGRRAYVATARAHGGGFYKVRIHAYSGNIMDVRPIRPHWGGGHGGWRR